MRPLLQSLTANPDDRCREAMNHQVAGRPELAEPLYREILSAQPGHANANHCLGMLYVQMRQPSLGLPHLLASLETNPKNPDYWLGYLEALLSNGQLVEATSTLALGRQHGLESAAVDEFARRLTARILQENQEVRHAPSAPAPIPARAERRRESRDAAKMERVLLDLLTQGKLTEAGDAARALTERFPDRGLGWKTLGALQWAEGRPDLALASMEKSVGLLPRDAEALANLGALLTKLQRVDAAETYLNRALEIDPDLAIAYPPLGDVYQVQGRYDEAEAVFRRAISLPFARADWHEDMRHTSLLFMVSHNPTIGADALFAEHRRVGMAYEALARTTRTEHCNSRDPERRLKIGVVSGDLFTHPVATFVEPVLEKLNGRDGLELTAYYNHVVEDQTTGRLRRHVERWRPIFALSDAQLERQIIDDGIDILIDLSGHTSRNRLRAFARKPAPVQASWLGYPGTTGLSAVDYYFADPYWLPPGQFDRHFVEKLIYLPATAIFQPEPTAPPVNALPALAAGHLTFGSFNRLGKINAGTIGLWSKLLRALPTSRLILAGIPLDGRHHQLMERFAAEEVAPERLVCHARGPIDAYLALHHQVDLCLDTFPYNGGTTTHHALWMGVPTLTMTSTTPAGRQGAGILGLAGLGEFIATDAADFVAKGLHWATRLTSLAELRAGLRERCRQAPSQRPEVLVAALERALRRMWTRWCAGLPAESFEVGAGDQ
jgi:predicted O-linked N-acetylglucosamine transferase (SPINDLY family)